MINAQRRLREPDGPNLTGARALCPTPPETPLPRFPRAYRGSHKGSSGRKINNDQNGNDKIKKKLRIIVPGGRTLALVFGPRGVRFVIAAAAAEPFALYHYDAVVSVCVSLLTTRIYERASCGCVPTGRAPGKYKYRPPTTYFLFFFFFITGTVETCLDKSIYKHFFF